MNRVFMVLGLISWIICFINETIYNIKNYNNSKYFKNFKSKVGQIIRLDKLFLITIFIIYVRFNKDFITSLLFAVICLYLYINKLYEKTKKMTFKEILKNNWLTILTACVFASIPFVFYGLTKKLEITCIALLFYIFFNYFIVGISVYLSKLIIKRN